MKSFGSYISKYLVSFVAFILILLFLNAVVFGLTFQKIVTEDYGDSSPQAMLEMTATAATPEQLSDETVQKLRQNLAPGHNVGQTDIGNVDDSASNEGVQGRGAIDDNAGQTAQGRLQGYRAAGGQSQVGHAE